MLNNKTTQPSWQNEVLQVQGQSVGLPTDQSGVDVLGLCEAAHVGL